MPFTFFAHQAPVLPLKAWAPDRWDGLALAVGSIMPDLWYVTSGWLFDGFGNPMWVDGHRLDLIVQNCVIPGTILTILLRRWTMPVVPAVLPKGGFLRLRDYRLLGFGRHRWWVTAYSVLVGALTHLLFDGLTHGSMVRQIVASVLGGLAAVWMLVSISRRKLQWSWHRSAGRRPPDPVVAPPGTVVVWAVLAAGTALAAAYATTRLDDGVVPALMAFTWVMLGTLLVAGFAGGRYVAPLPVPLPAALDPLVE